LRASRNCVEKCKTCERTRLAVARAAGANWDNETDKYEVKFGALPDDLLCDDDPVVHESL
jgi:hypothetical protein